jgi:hypothetical protein
LLIVVSFFNELDQGADTRRYFVDAVSGLVEKGEGKRRCVALDRMQRKEGTKGAGPRGKD